VKYIKEFSSQNKLLKDVTDTVIQCMEIREIFARNHYIETGILLFHYTEATLANSVLVLLLIVSEVTQRAPHWICLCLSF
jgi:hypothetical protein